MGSGQLCSAFAQYFSGWLGDYVHSVRKYNGRVYVAQFSVAAGLVVMLVMLEVLPKDSSAMLLFIGTNCLFNLVATWPVNATNRPLIADVVPPWSRASIFSYFHMLETIPAAFGGYMVSYLAQNEFGYTKPNDISAISDAERAENIKALTSALVVIITIPWILCFLTYGTLHWT